MLVLAESRLGIRQALGTGQLTEAITGRPIEDFEIRLSYSHSDGSGPLPAALLKKPGGFFALQISPERTLPDFSARLEVTLTATIEIQGEPPFDVAQTVPGADLALADEASSAGGTPVTYRRIAGAPFDFSAQVAPRAVALQGIVLRDHDPASPIDDVTVTTVPAAPGGAVTSDADGIFFIPALPLAEAITLHLDDGETSADFPFRPDYLRPINTSTLSLLTPSS